jgi:hypothetical protein
MSGKINLNSDLINLNSDNIIFGRPPFNWYFVESNNGPTAFSPRVITTNVAGAIGCATSTEAKEALDTLFPASNYNLGDYARVTILDEQFIICTSPSYHWFIVGV